MVTFLFKTEPTTFAFADLVRDGGCTWDGVSNALALIHLRTAKTGDTVVIYHSGKDKAAFGIARVTRGAYPDPKLDDPKRVVLDVAPVRAFARPVPLALIKADAALQTMELVRNSRLSVMPITAAHLARLAKLGGRTA
jgi:predicted RNA-binding protein with PUA-like domain